MKNNILINCDTDAVMIAKPDQSAWTKDEQYSFLAELNKQFPELINFEHDGYFTTVVVIKAKNYVLQEEDGEVTYKGSSLKTSNKEPIMKEMMQEMLAAILADNTDFLPRIYERYCDMARNVTDIKPWCTKKTITKSVLKCKGYEKLTEEERKEQGIRKNETDVWDAIKDIHVQEGDKVYLYTDVISREVTVKHYKNGKTKEKVTEVLGLKLAQDFQGSYSVDKLLKRCYDTVKIFSNVIDITKFEKY